MKIILSSYTDLGNPSTPKGLEPEWLALDLIKRKIPVKVICRGVSKERSVLLDKKYIVQPVPFGNKIPLLFSAISKWICKNFPSRYLSTHLFDFCAKWHVRKADILCCEHPSLVREMRMAQKKGMKTFVFATSAHVIYTNKLYSEEYTKYGLKYDNSGNKMFDNYNITSYAEADLIFARSEYTRKSLIESGISKDKIYSKTIDVFYNSKKFKLNFLVKKDKMFRAVYVGQVCFSKGVHYLLEAWKELKLDNAELILCGGIEEDFKKTFPQYFNLPSIKFVGHVDPLSYLQNSSIFCFPSLSEGCSQAIVEAMACGLPIIATHNSGSLARNGQEGFVVPIRDSAAFAKQIKYLSEHPDKVKEMGYKGVERAKEFTIEAYSKRVADYLEDAYNSLK